jgi:IS30 family transposase
VLSVDDWAEIRRFRRSEGMSTRAIARMHGVSRNTVRNALAAQPPRYRRRPAGCNRPSTAACRPCPSDAKKQAKGRRGQRIGRPRLSRDRGRRVGQAGMDIGLR